MDEVFGVSEREEEEEEKRKEDEREVGFNMIFDAYM